MTTTPSLHGQPATVSGTPKPNGNASGAAGRDRELVSAPRLALTHAKWSIVEQFRIPIAWIASLAFPVLAFSFFVLPMQEVREAPASALDAIVSMLVFAFMTNGLFSFGLDLASQRAKPWAPYLRTLPGVASARIVGMIVATLVSAILSALPVLIVGFVFTAAAPDPGQFALGLVTLVVTAVPSALLGLIIGTTCGEKAAIGVTQLVMFTLAFASGLFLPPLMFPEWLELATRVLPVRAARDLTIAVSSGGAIEWWMLVSLVVWTVALAVIGVWLFRRDEGRRFR